jgi:hypothetical protein
MGRGVYSATCLVDPESELASTEQRIIVFWGDGKDAIHLPDIWILHVQSRTWREVWNKDWEWLRMARNGWEWLGMAGNGWGMVGNG